MIKAEVNVLNELVNSIYDLKAITDRLNKKKLVINNTRAINLALEDLSVSIYKYLKGDN